MPLPSQNVELIVEGLSQKQDEKSTPQGKLVRADNVEFDKAGALNKRRGYRALPIGADINGDLPDQVLSAAATFQNELLILGDSMWAVVSPDGGVDGSAFIRRGPVLRGAYRLRAIVGDGVGSDG